MTFFLFIVYPSCSELALFALFDLCCYDTVSLAILSLGDVFSDIFSCSSSYFFFSLTLGQCISFTYLSYTSLYSWTLLLSSSLRSSSSALAWSYSMTASKNLV